jgi:hypothetical protein
MTALNTNVLKGGLEINLSLLDPSECCFRPARSIALTAGLTNRLASDSYQLDDCFLNLIHYNSD